MPRKRSLPSASPPQHTQEPSRALPAPVLPEITTQWLAATGQAVPMPASGLDLVELACTPSAGRYSVNRAADSRAYHKWAFGQGKWRGYYVMWVGDPRERLDAGMSNLMDKVDQVHAGKLRPSRDPYFKG